LLSLSLCGASCASKSLIKNYHIIGDNDTVTVSGNVLTIDLGPAAKDFAFYELVLAAGLVDDTGGNALAADYSLEFFMDSGSGTPAGFDMETSTAKVKLGASSDEAVVFDFALAASTPPGSYNLCYCNDQMDITLAALGDSAETYKLQDDTTCHAKGIIDMDADADSCVSKCSAGCVGPNCYCSGLPEAKKGALCLPKEECAAKCTAESGCIGINVHDTLPICYLVDMCDAFDAPTPPAVLTVQVVTSSLALTMSAADIAVLMADEDTAMQAFATGLSDELGVTVVVTAITFGRRLSADPRELQSSVTVDFYTEDTSAFADIAALSSASDTTSLVGSLGTALVRSGMPVAIVGVTVAAPTYTSITTDPPPCNANVTNCTNVTESRALWGDAAYWAAAGDTGSHISLVPASYLYFAAEPGTACTQVTDFKERAGTVTVTSRVLVGVDYVVTPGINQSLEITGPDLTYDSMDLLSKDRVMVIDCGGTCGVSGPTDKMVGFGNVTLWNDLMPHSYFQDPPWADAQNDPVNVVAAATPVPTPAGYSYSVQYDSGYYAGFNVDVTDASLIVAIDGTMQLLKSFQCYEMCSSGCTGPWCKCGGYLSGIDGPTSNALCADRETCQYLCDQVDCQAIDMSKSADRCFLNTLPKSGDGSIDTVATHAQFMADAGYQIVSQMPPNSGPAARKLEEPERRAQALLPPVDLGYSWSQILRFKDLTFTTGGTFKLCFCDSTLLGGTATPCLTAKDYAVEVGKVHSSGVSCLLSQPKLQRAACVPMMHGDMPKPLRCYSGPPPMLSPPLIASTQVSIDESVATETYVPPAGSSAGSYAPEEDSVLTVPQSGNAAPPGGKGPR